MRGNSKIMVFALLAALAAAAGMALAQGLNDSNLTNSSLGDLNGTTGNQTINNTIISADAANGPGIAVVQGANNINGTTNTTSANLPEVDETNTTIANETDNLTLQNNSTFGTPDNATNSTAANDTGNVSADISQKASLFAAFSLDGKVTRGNVVHVSAAITNTGTAKTRGLRISWDLPAGFSAVRQQDDCSELDVGASCTAQIDISTSISTPLGSQVARLVLDYD